MLAISITAATERHRSLSQFRTRCVLVAETLKSESSQQPTATETAADRVFAQEAAIFREGAEPMVNGRHDKLGVVELAVLYAFGTV